MAAPSTRQELIDYALRKLGHPVIEINVDDDQLEDRIDEALQFYQEYHSDAIYKVYHKHQITATDIANEYISLPDAITTVQRVLPLVDSGSSISMFDARYQIALNDIYDLGFVGGLSHYTQVQSYISTLDMKLNGADQVRFNRHMNRLFLDIDWDNDVKDGNYIIVDAYRIVDPGQHSDVYNDMFLKRYATALIKRQWGQNLSKFEGMQLPGGVTINSRQYVDEANEEIQRIEEEMQLKYEMPPDFYMG